FRFALPLSELQRFRQWGSLTPGHPEFPLTPGVETTTGPLGQGFANGVGIALSSKLLAEEYSPDIFNYRVFGIVSDGDLMEGISGEAASLAGHLALSNLIYIYDDNEISIGGDTDVCFTEDVPKRFDGYNWYVQSVDGHDIPAVRECLKRALAQNSKPSLICAHTKIGYGSPNKCGDAEVHGAPLGDEELKLTKQNLSWPLDKPFLIPDEIAEFCKAQVEEKLKGYEEWQGRYQAWRASNADKAKGLDRQLAREIPPPLKEALLTTFKDIKKEATRSLSGKAIQVIAKHCPYFIGGSADLEPSTKTLIKDSKEIQPGQMLGRNIRFGVREHAMGALANGLAYSRCWVPFTATFLVFSDYMRPTIRLAAISHLQTLFIFTHDSFWVGEDGPTHQPIEHTASLRLIPNLYVFRPADGMEVAMCYHAALRRQDGPSAMLFTRQDLPTLERAAGFSADTISQGAYLLSERPNAAATLVATGSEVWVAAEAAKILEPQGINVRVVSMPCVELFMAQDKGYRDSVLKPGMRNISLEAGVTTGWEALLGPGSLKIGIDHFGASAPGGVLAEKFGFTPAAVAEKIGGWIRNKS
ncbi:MAG: transketolase, partial [Proteobacteria bacterium]